MNYVIKNHFESTLKNVNYTKLFVIMHARNNARENASTRSDEPLSFHHEEPRRLPFNPQWSKEREYDSDELFFNQDDEEEDEDMEVYNLVLTYFQSFCLDFVCRLGLGESKAASTTKDCYGTDLSISSQTKA